MKTTRRSACLCRRIIDLNDKCATVRAVEQGIEGHRQHVHADPNVNPKKYWKQIATIATGQETYAVQRTGDPKIIAFTNRYSDSEGFGFLTVTDDSVSAFAATPTTIPLSLGTSSDTFDVNNGISVLILPADAFKSVIGTHPAYAFVGGYNRFIQGDPSHDPDAFLNGSGFSTPPPGGSNIGIIRDPFNGGSLVAATLPIPIGVIDNLAFASGNNYLFAGEWWVIGFPGFALAALILSLNLVGDWLRDALNPKLQ